MKRKLSILIISIFTLLLWGNKVDAASLAYASDMKKDSNTTEIGVFLHVSSGENVTQAKFVCSTDNAEVKCEVKKNENYKRATILFDGGIISTLSEEGLPDGENEVVKIVLTNESSKAVSVKVSLDGSTYSTNESQKSYTLSVDKKSSGNALASSVKFSQGTMVPEFNPNVFEYTVYNIQDTINSVIGTHECQDANTCDFSWSGGKSISNLNKIFLNMGENKVTLELTSENGQNKQTYNFTIIRGESAFNSSKLATLKIGNYILTPAFSKDIFEYSVNIPNKITSIDNELSYTAEDSKANISIEKPDSLVVGENIIKITVDNVNSDGTSTYTIKVNRMSLESIEVTNYKNGIVTYLDSEGVKYELAEDEFKMQYPDDYIKIIDNTYKFDENGERITDTNKDDGEIAKEEKKETKKDNKVLLIVCLVIVGLIIIIVSGILIFKKKPENKNNKKDKPNKEDKTSEEDSKDDEIDETGVEEEAIKLTRVTPHNEDDTVDIDEALSDLMSTKQYNLDDLTKKEE